MLNLFHVYEAKAGDAVKPLEWFLLTSLAVSSADDATEVSTALSVALANRGLAQDFEIRLQGGVSQASKM